MMTTTLLMIISILLFFIQINAENSIHDIDESNDLKINRKSLMKWIIGINEPSYLYEYMPYDEKLEMIRGTIDLYSNDYDVLTQFCYISGKAGMKTKTFYIYFMHFNFCEKLDKDKKIRRIMKTLDENINNDILIDEFFNYCIKLSEMLWKRHK